MSRKEHTQRLVDALRAVGVSISALELCENAEDADLIRLHDDYYLAVGYDDFDRVGIIHVSLDVDMHAGGNPTIQHWMIPTAAPEQVAAAVAAEITSD